MTRPKIYRFWSTPLLQEGLGEVNTPIVRFVIRQENDLLRLAGVEISLSNKVKGPALGEGCAFRTRG